LPVFRSEVRFEKEIKRRLDGWEEIKKKPRNAT